MNIKLAHFDLLEELGHGGLGMVFRAFDPSLNRFVAIKLLKDEFAQDPQFVDNFLRESRNAAAISHPHIAQVHFVGEHEGNYYMVMELVPGRSLEQIVREDGPMSEAKALRVAIEVTEALKAGYVNQMIHGDIKPQNIVVGEECGAKLLDFGLAQLANVEVDETGSIWGSPYYISPERVGRKAEDFRSDIYSLGATIFEMLVGHPPFEAEDPTQLALKRINEKPPLLRTLNPNISKRTEQIIDKMLHKNLLMRYLDYDALLKELRKAEAAALGQQPLTDTMEFRHATGRITGPLPVATPRSLLPTILAVSLASCLAVGGLGYLLIAKKTAAQTNTAGTATPTVVAGPTPLSMKNGSKIVRFRYANGGAKQVLLAGNFDMWQPEPMKPEAAVPDTWFIDKEIPLGVAIEYQFVVDGKSIADPLRKGLSFPDGKGSFKTIWDPSASATPTPKPATQALAAATPSPSRAANDPNSPYQRAMRHCEQLLMEFKGSEADAEARTLSPQGPAEGEQRIRITRLMSGQKNFVDTLKRDILRKGYPMPIEKRDGSRLEGGVSKVSDDGLVVSVASGDVAVPFKDISLASLLAMNDYFSSKETLSDLIASHNWNSGILAIIMRSKAEGKARMEAAIKLNPTSQSYPSDMALILTYTSDQGVGASAITSPLPKVLGRIVYAGFDIPETNKIALSPLSSPNEIGLTGTWSSTGGKIISPGLTYNGMTCIGNAVQFFSNVAVERTIDMNAMPAETTQVDVDGVTRMGKPGASLWIRFLVRVDAPDTTGTMCTNLNLMGNSSGGGCKLGIGLTGSSNNWGLVKGKTVAASNVPTVTGSTVLLVTHVKFNNGKSDDEVDLFVNPPMGPKSPATPDATLRDIHIGTFDRIQFKGMRESTADELSIATDWEKPAMPTPSPANVANPAASRPNSPPGH